MPIIIRTRGGKVKCPVCDKLTKSYYDEELDIMVLDCCNKKWSLFRIGPQKNKKKRRKKKK